MSETSAARQVIVRNPRGLHLRPANLFATLASRFASQVEIVKGIDRFDGKSVLAVMTIFAEQGTELSIEAVGPDAETAVKQLAELIESTPEEDDQPSEKPLPK